MPKHDLRKPGSNRWKSLPVYTDENGKSFSVYAGFGKLRVPYSGFFGPKCGRPTEAQAFLSQVVVLRKFKTIAKTIPKDPYMLPSSSQPSKEDHPRSLLDLRRRWTRAICIGSVFALSHVEPNEALAQQPPRKQESNRKVDSKAANAPKKDKRDSKDTPQEALNIYSDAANLQNNAAYDVAIEEWAKLIEKFPNDPITSKAQHYMGVCYLRLSPPRFDKAIPAFEAALKDEKLEVREESMVNLGWSMYLQSNEATGAEKTEKLQRALVVFQKLLKDYSDGSFADRAMFYAGECEYALGNGEKAAKHYADLLNSSQWAKSSMRPDALYASGVNFEELKQDAKAKEAYDDFLKNHKDHKLNPDVTLRRAEIALRANQPDEAVKLLGPLVEAGTAPIPDYALYRYGFALTKLGKFDESSKIYKRLSDEFPNSQYASGAILAAGQTLMRDKKYDEASSYFQKLLAAKDEQAAESAYWLCQIATLQGKSSEAAKIARQALTWATKSKFTIPLQVELASALMDDRETRAEARSIFEKIATDSPEDPLAARATYNAAFGALQMGDPTNAKKWSDLFIQKFPKDPLAVDANYVNAESLLLLGSHAESIQAYRKLIDSNRDNAMLPVWQLRLATARFVGRQYADAEKQLNDFMGKLKDESQIAEAQFLLGACQFQQEKFAEAADMFAKSLKTSSKWSQADEVQWMLAQAYQEQDKLDEATTNLEQLISNYPNGRFKTQAQYRLGQIAASRGEYDKAIQRYDEILNAPGTMAFKDFSSYSKAWVLLQQKKFDESMKLLLPLVEGDRNDNVAAESRMTLAVCQRQAGQMDQAVATLEKILQLKPEGDYLADCLYELGVTHSQKKDYAKAVELLERVKKEFPDNFGRDKVLYELAWAYKEIGNTEEASKNFEELQKNFPDSPLSAEASFHVGQTEYANEKFDSAAKAYMVAFKNSKDVSLQERALHKLGWAMFKKQDYPAASEQFAQQISSFPNGELYVDALFMQAQCSFKSEKYSDASGLYSRALSALEKHPDQESIGENIRALIYLQGAQSARELKQWAQAEKLLTVFRDRFNNSPYWPDGLYELAYCYQNQQKTEDALKLYGEVAGKFRSEIAARSRFMMGEVYFAQRDFAKAIPEFQRVMFGYGGNQAAEPIKNWQARSAFEAGRCAELLIGDLKGERRTKAIGIAKDFYKFVVENHPNHELVKQAKARIDELSTM